MVVRPSRLPHCLSIHKLQQPHHPLLELLVVIANFPFEVWVGFKIAFYEFPPYVLWDENEVINLDKTGMEGSRVITTSLLKVLSRENSRKIIIAVLNLMAHRYSLGSVHFLATPYSPHHVGRTLPATNPLCALPLFR